MTIFDKNADTQDKVQYHLRVRPGDVADYVLLPGDPGRVELIAGASGRPEEIAYHREYRTVTGSYHGIPVSATSTGIGCPSAAIAVEELYNVGVSHFIRVGSSAASFPASPRATSSSTRVHALRRCERYVCGRGIPGGRRSLPRARSHRRGRRPRSEPGDSATHIGINVSSDGFYAETPEWVERMIKHKIMNVEMESSAIFTIAHLRGAKAAMVCGMFVQLHGIRRGRLRGHQ